MTAPTRRRTRAREIAMQILFQVDLRGPEYLQELDRPVADLCLDEAQGDADIAKFATRLVEGTVERREEIDNRLQSVTRNWDLRRMANIDRNVLRMAIFELAHSNEVPPKVAINEAIDLAKKFSTANSGGFVNGILDRVRIDLEQEQKATKKAPTARQATSEQGDVDSSSAGA